MGFCLLNSIAIGTYHALQHPDVSRVAILDFDVHHGNGTVDIFRDVPEVLVCSSFQHPFYPHRFYDSDWSNIINTPLAEGSGGSAFRAAIEAQWLPAIEAHKPDIIMVSAGFDGHADDLLAGLNLVEGDFTWVTQLIVSVANQYAKGRIVSTLEGGYDLGALAGSVEAHLTALA
jgi:acetoin utilization deacetylase AcuC-like enzyme